MQARIAVTIKPDIDPEPIEEFMRTSGLTNSVQTTAVNALGPVSGIGKMKVLGFKIVGEWRDIVRNPEAGMTHERFLRNLAKLQKDFPGAGVIIEVT